MMKIVSVAASFAAIAAAGPRWGETCSAFYTMNNIDLERYAGTWYEIVRDRATPFELMA